MAGTYAYALGAPSKNPNSFTVNWTSDSSGNFSETFAIKGTILRVVTDPGVTAPTDNYDVTLTDEYGIDVLYGGGANRDTANSEDFEPLATGSDGTTKMPVTVNGNVRLDIANAGNAKTGTFVVFFR